MKPEEITTAKDNCAWTTLIFTRNVELAQKDAEANCTNEQQATCEEIRAPEAVVPVEQKKEEPAPVVE